MAKVNGKELPGKPSIKWFKGKWQELSTKTGARFSLKESHDSASNVRALCRRWAVPRWHKHLGVSRTHRDEDVGPHGSR